MENEPIAITRRIEIDTAHRVPHHKSKCFNLHGHRYIIEVTCFGVRLDAEQTGMVMDFGFLKECMVEAIYTPCDHGTIFWINDPMAATINHGAEGWKVVLLQEVPTAENLAKYWFGEVQDAIDHFFAEHYPQYPTPPQVAYVDVWETPNCRARYPALGEMHISMDEATIREAITQGIMQSQIGS